MAFFMDPGAMFLGCLGPSEQKFLVTLIETAAKSGYTRFVEPCAGTFAMANLAVQNGFKPEQIETSDVNMMSTVLGYAITGQSLEPLEIHAQGFSDEELLDPATALYAQLYLRTSKNAGNDYFYQILTDLRLRREEHIESINRQIEVIKNLLGGMSYRPLDMWEHLKEVLDDPHALVIANPPTYFSGYEKFYDTQGKMTWKEPPYELFDPETGHQQFYDLCMDAKALVICYQEKRVGEAVGYTIYARSGTRADLNASDNLVGKVDNDTNGRATVISQLQAVGDAMREEGKLVACTVSESSAYTADGDSAWFDIDVIDKDSMEHMKSNYEIESCLTAEVYRSSLGDCTNNGISSYARELYILDAQKGPFEPDDIRQCVYIEKREIMGQEYVDCKPAYCRKRWYMAGGNILYTSDSRFKQITGISYPIAIHDRYEGR